MMDRFRRNRGDGPGRTPGGARSATATRDHDHGEVREERSADEERFSRSGGIDRASMAAAHERQREEFGGIHWGAAFFGFLATAGLAAILAGIVSAAGATLSFATDSASGAAADTIGIIGGIALLLVLGISYFAGGYVAGRMSRFDGARQGLGVFLVALAITIVLAVAGAILGAEYNVLAQLNLPRIPVSEGDLALGGVIALLIGLIVSVLAAVAGGKAGERYHKKIDRLAVDR